MVEKNSHAGKGRGSVSVSNFIFHIFLILCLVVVSLQNLKNRGGNRCVSGISVVAAPRTWTTAKEMETVPPMMANRTRKHKLTQYVHCAPVFHHQEVDSYRNRSSCAIHSECENVLKVPTVLQGMQLSSMAGDLLPVAYESSDEKEMEEEEEEEKVVVSATSKTR